jgi:hypothetical protein
MSSSDQRNHFDTPTKAKVRGAVEFLEAKNIEHTKADVFRHFGVTHRQGWAMISEGSVDRRHHNRDDLGGDTRGRKPIISPQHIREMERIIRDEGFAGRAMTWAELAYEAGIEGVHPDTVKRAMGSMDYHKCIACQKGWVNEKTAKDRVEWSKAALQRRPEPEDWHIVRFSDEVHFALGPQGRVYIIRRPGERYCADCIQHKNEPTEQEKEMNKIHAWAAVGYNFKSDLIFYNIKSNTNGKMTQKDYISQILEPVVKPWLNGPRFILEEDGDSGHGPGKSNTVRTWKKNHGLEFYFNCHSSPDLAPIENCWQPPKQYVKKFPHWDEDDTRELALEGWEKVTQEFINSRVNSMPQRLRDVIENEGKLTGY